MYVANMDEEEQNQQGQNNPSQGKVAPAGGGGVQTSVGGGPLSSGGGGGGGGGAGGAKSGGGGAFATLNDYVTANAPNAQGLTNQVLAPINQSLQTQTGSVNQALSDAQSGVNAGYTPQNQGLLDQANQDIVSFTNDPNNVKAFQAQANDQYTGPQSVETTPEYQSVNSGLQNTVQEGLNATQTSAGQQGLLQGVEANPGNAGVTALNEAILTQNPNTLSQITGAYQPFQALEGTLASGAQAIDPSIGQAQTQAQQASKNADALIANNVSNLNSQITGATTQAQNTAQNLNTQIAGDVTSQKLSDQDLANLGMTQDQWSALQAELSLAQNPQTVSAASDSNFTANTGNNTVSLSPYLTQGTPQTAITNANVATAPEYQQANAYETLMNGINQSQTAPVITNATAAQAGTAPTNLNSFAYNQALSGTTSQEQAEQAAAQAYINDYALTQDANHAAGVAAEQAKLLGYGTIASGTMLPMAVGAGSAIANNFEDMIQHPTIGNITEDYVLGGPEAAIGAVKGAISGVEDAVHDVTQMFSGGGSWVCSAMRRAGVLTQAEVDKLHDHLYKAFWKRPFAFMRYWIIGRPVVWYAEKHTHWQVWREAFYDDVMKEKDPAKAVDLYEKAFWELFKAVIL